MHFMKPFFGHPSSVIRLSIFLHISWGILIWQEHEIGNITALYLLPKNVFLISTILLLSSTLAFIPFCMATKRTVTAFCFFFQQVVLYLSALGAMDAAWRGHYGDGVQHPELFIFADQLLHVCLAYYHTKSAIHVAMERQK